MRSFPLKSIVYTLLVIVTADIDLRAADWPTWRADAARSASTSSPLPKAMTLRWTRQLEMPEAAWPTTQHKLQFDRSYEPIVAGKRVFIGSMVADYVAAFDTESGALLWRTCLGGPVRFAPLYWQERLYVVCDDGLLHCLNASDGSTHWVMQGSPDRRMVLGNFRLISAWPARGAPVLQARPDGGATLYYAAGIWPFMGIFIHAIDATTGKLIWRNGGSGSTYVIQQHNSPAFAGVAPQGYLAITGERLMMPGGRTVPAGFNAQDGAMDYFEVSSRGYGKDAGGYEVSTMPDSFFNHGCLYELKTGGPLLNLNSSKIAAGNYVARIGDHFVAVSNQVLRLYPTTLTVAQERSVDRKGKEQFKEVKTLARPIFSSEVGWPLERAWFQAGNNFYVSGTNGEIASVTLTGEQSLAPTWHDKVVGKIFTMLPGDNKLFVVTEEGLLYCFGAAPQDGVIKHTLPQAHAHAPHSLPGEQGYAMLFGLTEESLARIAALARDYHVVAFDPNLQLLDTLRQELLDRGLYGHRTHLLPYVPGSMQLPPYLAAHIECAGTLLASPTTAAEIIDLSWHSLRPYGGSIEFHCPKSVLAPTTHNWRNIFKKETGNAAASCTIDALLWQALTTGVAHLEPQGAKITLDSHTGTLRVQRPGALPGSGTWTHENGNAGNTVVSRDVLVKPPLGMLWFGGLSNDDILPRHGHGPMPQIVGGRLYIEGPDVLRAVDVYTGHLHWQRHFKGLGKFYDNTSHQPGANEIGSNYVSMEDGIYLVYQGRCLHLDLSTGATLGEFELPRLKQQNSPTWGYIGVWQNYLVAGASPLLIKDAGKDKPPTVTTNATYASSSKWIVVFDRHSRQPLWQREAHQAFRHNAIALGSGKLFCVDRISEMNLQLLKRRGIMPEHSGELLALDLPSGQELWRSGDNIRGTWLGYDEPRDLLLEGGSPGRDRARDEINRHLALYKGSSGTLLWHVKPQFNGRPMLHNKYIYGDTGAAYDLVDGAPIAALNHLTGTTQPWRLSRNHGCNTPIAGQHLLLFRSAAAGYYDLIADAGTGNFGGFKSGCTSNIIPADGILNVPDYTRTCTCSYQNQCSLALAPMPDVEAWTFQSYDKLDGSIKRAGLNFGAPGDWLAPNGTLWLDTPSVGGKGPDLSVRIRGDVKYFRDHSLYMLGRDRQVTASGVEGNFNVKIPLNSGNEEHYTVRFYFAEPHWQTAAGERAFDLYLQGKRVIRAYDIIAETHQPRLGVVKEFANVSASDALRFELRARHDAKKLPILNGIEFVRES